MKLNMRLLVLLLAGNAQVFAAIKDIPSMKPAEIVKLDYAALSQAEQNSLWFTAMFTGLQANRTAARQVISKKFPAVKWQDIEGIALSAKQSNKIDDGIARAQATVGITKTVVPTTPAASKTSTPVVLRPGTKSPVAKEEPVVKPSVVDTAAQPQGKPAETIWPIVGVIDGQGKPLEEVVSQQQSNRLTDAQWKAFETLIKTAENYQDLIVALDPKTKKIDYINKIKPTNVNKSNINEIIQNLNNEVQRLKDRLEDLEETKQLLDIKLEVVARFFNDIHSIDRNYKIELKNNIRSYNDFQKMIIKEKQKSLEHAYNLAQDVELELNSILAELRKQQQQKEQPLINISDVSNDNIGLSGFNDNNDERGVRDWGIFGEAKRFLDIARRFNQLRDEIVRLDPKYSGKNENYVNKINEMLQRGYTTNEDISSKLDRIEKELNDTLFLTKQVYAEYASNFDIIEGYKSNLKEKNKPIPSQSSPFEYILSNNGLKKAVEAQKAYIELLKERLK